MEKQSYSALFKASYGLYLLSVKNNVQDNACIINTFLQITSNEPCLCTISVNKQNFTTEILSKSLEFNLSILNIETPFEIFKRFGYQSGRNINKFKDFTSYTRSANELVYLPEYSNALLSFNVLEMFDFGSHILFKSILTESETLNDKESITYDYYQRNVKPKPQASEKQGYRCNVCGYVYEGETLPENFICPLCKHGAADFVKI
ncbi:MAG: flavin reductase [Bacteroidales bacterium]|jgi:flavin reductase (DIM6/NTAB) family NADH-FMN oxidoreductase RutF|nr:flavin reductase [Bacteroidales bacterium]